MIMRVLSAVPILVVVTLACAPLYAQAERASLPDAPSPGAEAAEAQQEAQAAPSSPPGQVPLNEPTAQGQQNTSQPRYGQQPKRILGILPNLRAVSVGAKVPQPNLREKFRLATANSFDYSGFLDVGFEAALRSSRGTYRQFGDGMKAYGQYYWRNFADRATGNYMTNAILATITDEDTRYYTLGRGRWYKRSAYAFTRVLITPDDQGHDTFNFSEVAGKGAAAGLGNLYYPGGASWTRTGQRWVFWLVLDGSYDVFREFWPDISRKVLHRPPPPISEQAGP